MPADEDKRLSRAAAAAAPLLTDFREQLDQRSLTDEERDLVARQAARLVDDVYVHQWQKRAMYGIDASQRLRLLRRRLGQLSEAEFHNELQRIFTDLRDLHTLYVLPRPYVGKLATVGMLIEQCWVDGEPRWLVSHVRPELVGDPKLVRGAEITHWNGAPIAVAVARNAEKEGGSNPPARLARGRERMTQRSLAVSQVPDEDWVEVRYTVGGETRETRIPWRIVSVNDEITPTDGTPVAAAGADGETAARTASVAANVIAMDLRTEVVRQVKRALFAPPDIAAAEPTLIPNNRPDGELKARVITTAHGTFGHLRLYTFHMEDQDYEGFLREIRRLLTLMPRDGLIIDVRGNGGGYVYAAEALLQYFTPRIVRPEPFQFVNTEATAELSTVVEWLGPWHDSIGESIETGAQYSTAIPFFSEDEVNDFGQLYHGPVVLVTDALCYSATDIFAAGFQDNEIGPVLGVEGNTGAGGATVWEHSDLVNRWPGGPFKALPRGARLRVSLLRTLRVGAHAGQPLEDLGVLPNEVHQLTRRDLLEGNADLFDAAGALLAKRTPRQLDVEARPMGSMIELSVTTANLSSLDCYVDGRPVKTVGVPDGRRTVTVPAGEHVRLEGFDGTTLAAARTLRFAVG
jgi:C-terminal processing protease CtpA/Prc